VDKLSDRELGGAVDGDEEIEQNPIPDSMQKQDALKGNP
jgi:hypothetical protein